MIVSLAASPPGSTTTPPGTTTPKSSSSRFLSAGDRVYISMQGDFWDLIAIKVYGRQRGNEHLMYRLLEENYPIREIVQFPAGIPVVVPMVDVATVITLVPWKTATVGSAT